MIQAPPPPPPVVLVVLMDDVGYYESTTEMPYLDTIRGTGVDFTRAYAQAWCAPTRDALLFGDAHGRFRGHLCEGYRPGVSHEAGDPSLMRALEDNGWETWLVGKWGLGNAPRHSIGWEESALFWFRHWRSGNNSALTPARQAPCNDPSIWQYPRSAGANLMANDGFLAQDTRYDLEKEWGAAREALDSAPYTPGPDLVVVSTRAAHQPWVTPPDWMLPVGYVTPADPTPRERYLEEVWALDWVIWDLVCAAPHDAWVVIAGDNGTPPPADVDDLRGSKGEPYEGGLRVPLVVRGPGLAPGVVDDPVHLYDVPATLLASLGVAAPWCDGQDLFGGGRRGWVAAQTALEPDLFPGLQDAQVIVESRWKLVRWAGGAEELFDLWADPQEANPLPPAGPDYDRLAALMKMAF